MKHLKLFEQYLNDNFNKWFGDSKVVDEQGKPLVVYHGTASDFDAYDKNYLTRNFSSSKLGFYFTNFPKADFQRGWDYGVNASEYSTNAQKKGAAELDGANVQPVYLKIEKPLYIDADGWYSAVSAVDKQVGPIKRELEAGDYDGVISKYSDKEESNETVYVVLEPNQVKSAIGNSGDFNLNSDSIIETKSNI